ncbi:MAG TPA: AAA family ATPase [Kofleriaceae bacterium]|nr:AAA family ATPase [Kofleriaceae bacterium]
MLVGRDRELAEVERALAQLGSGRGAVFLLAGEPGIGKTRLATEIESAARARSVRSAWGRCWESGGAPAFWPWREAIEGLGARFPEPGAITATDPGEARFALLREVGEELARQATVQPTLLVLEDLHAADRSSLLLFEHVAAQVRACPLVVVGTYRELEASLRAEVGDSLARLGRGGRVLQLARLRAPEVEVLVRDAIEDADARLIAAVYETTQGNPLFVDEIVREVRARGAGGELPIPLGVREIIRQRIALVAPEVRRVLEAAAVVGVSFGTAEITRMLDDARALLDDATRSGLVVAQRERFRFSHALYREALYHDLPRARRQALHADAARALAATAAPLVERAHHLLEAGPDHAAAAIDHAIRAAEQALDNFAFEDAMQLLERARAAIPTGDSELALRCRVTIAIGHARIRSGDAGGRELCLDAARTARELADPTLLALAGLAYGAVFVMGAVDRTLVEILDDALARLPPASALRARVMARLAAARQPSPPAERARDIELGLAAIALARELASPRELLDVLHSAAGALYGAAHPSLRLPISREMEHLAEELGDTTRLLHARTRMALDYLELGDFASYAQLAATYETLAQRVGPAAAPWRVPLMRSMIALAADRFDESERWQAASVEIDGTHPRARRAQAFHRICFARAAERHAELRARIPELRNLWLAMPYGVILAEPRVASTFARLGDERETRAILAQLPEVAFAEQINVVSLGEAIWLAGDPSHAAKLYPVVEALGDRWMMYWLDVEIVEGPLGRIRAYLDGILGRWDDADRRFERALHEVEAAGRRAFAARMRFEYGDLRVRGGRDGHALLADARRRATEAGLGDLVALIDARHAAPVAATPTTATPRGGFAIALEGEYFAVTTARATLRFKASRGMHYLARLVGRPGVELHVLELVGSSDADRGDGGELLDGKAFAAYRARLELLRAAADDADAIGHTDRAEQARSEMTEIAAELSRATGRGGRARRSESAVDRARSAVQRRIKDALDRIADQDADLGSWLRRSVHTGNYCRYQPAD